MIKSKEKIFMGSLLQIFFFFFVYLPSPNLGLTPPGTYNPNARESDACRGSNSLWTRTLDRYTTADFPECVVSSMSGSPPVTTQDRTQTKDTHPIPGQKLKFVTLPGIEPGPPRRAGMEGRDSVDHATATDLLQIIYFNSP